jgi:hypothetical protein
VSSSGAVVLSGCGLSTNAGVLEVGAITKSVQRAVVPVRCSRCGS